MGQSQGMKDDGVSYVGTARHTVTVVTTGDQTLTCNLLLRERERRRERERERERERVSVRSLKSTSTVKHTPNCHTKLT